MLSHTTAVYEQKLSSKDRMMSQSQYAYTHESPQSNTETQDYYSMVERINYLEAKGYADDETIQTQTKKIESLRTQLSQSDAKVNLQSTQLAEQEKSLKWHETALRQKAEDELKKMAPVNAKDSVMQVRRFDVSPSRIEELSNFVKVAGMDQGVLWCELY
jgi:ribosomal protein L9